MKIKAGPEFVVLTPVTEEMSSGGIVLASSGLNDKLRKGIVVSVGPLLTHPIYNGSGEYVRESLDFQVGDIVLYSVYAGEEFTEGGEKFVVCRGKEIRATVM